MPSRPRKNRQRKSRFARRSLPGAPPGLLVPDPAAAHSCMRVMAYGRESYVEEAVSDVDSLSKYLTQWPVTWINVDGLGDTTVIQKLGKLFGFHSLSLEDVVHTHQRAKVEQYDDYHFIVARMPLPGERFESEQISIFLGRNFVVSFQEAPGGDCLDPVRLRIRTSVSRLRNCGPDHLVYAILDSIIDHYFPMLEDCGERLDVLEDEVLQRPDASAMSAIHKIKRDLLNVRRAVWPLREAMTLLLRDTTALISNETRVYLRDCYDHTVQIIELLESYRDIAGGLTDVYLSTLSNRTNEIMKVLTVITTIFIPLTFIVGVYGMNFNTESAPWSMPELNWRWGYPGVLLMMGVVAGSLLLFFRHKGWLGTPKIERTPSEPAPEENQPERPA